MDNLFLKLVKLQRYDGDLRDISQIYSSEQWKDFYFKNILELNFYLETLMDKKLVSNTYGKRLEKDGRFIRLNITYDGLSRAIELQDEGKNSTNCFLQCPLMKKIMEFIRKLFSQLVKKQDLLQSELIMKTSRVLSSINDAIIVLIKQCRFCIADFTKQKDGVYFESGYAAEEVWMLFILAIKRTSLILILTQITFPILHTKRISN